MAAILDTGEEISNSCDDGDGDGKEVIGDADWNLFGFGQPTRAAELVKILTPTSTSNFQFRVQL